MKILGFTGSRADFYLQQPVFRLLRDSSGIDLQLIVAGGILDEPSGQTLNDIAADQISIFAKLALRDELGTSHSAQIAYLLAELDKLISVSDADIALVYADRYESFAFALSAFHRDLVVAHLEAGDVTEGGTYDDSIRHCITKMSHIQATSTAKGIEILKGMGEEPWRSKHVGLLSYDSIRHISISKAFAVSDALGLSRDKSLILATMHPIPRDLELSKRETISLLEALASASKTGKFDIILTAPNEDSGSELIKSLIRQYLRSISNCSYIESLGGYRYQALLSLARKKSVIVCGNTSSVVKEAPYYGAHGLNVGRRQLGREKAATQIDVPAEAIQIEKMLHELGNIKCKTGNNPYLKDNASQTFVDFLLATYTSRQRSELLLKRWNH